MIKYDNPARDHEPVLLLTQSPAIHDVHTPGIGPHAVQRTVGFDMGSSRVLKVIVTENYGIPSKTGASIQYQVDIENGFVKFSDGRVSTFLLVTPPGQSLHEVLCDEWKSTPISGGTRSEPTLAGILKYISKHGQLGQGSRYV